MDSTLSRVFLHSKKASRVGCSSAVELVSLQARRLNEAAHRNNRVPLRDRFEDFQVDRPPIFTIGYGNRPIGDFLQILQEYRIGYVIDVRSRPYSKFNPEFSQEYLKRYLRANAILYVFMGDTLGGQPADTSCYTDGKVDYSKCREKTFFQSGIERIKTAWDKRLSVAIMCSETKPEDCHRSKLIGEELSRLSIAVAHIDERGNARSQADIISKLIEGNPDQLSWLDDNRPNFTSRKKYLANEEE